MREKLIELILASGEVCFTQSGEELADHLMANGVAVQQWISVNDRLPERWQNVLSVSKYGKVCVDYVFTDGSWWSDRDVTHWMPLPQPPKGE